MFIEINGIDFSDFTDKYGYTQTPVKRQGPNFGADGLGNGIDDIIGTTYDVAWVIRVCPASTVKQFADIAKQAEVSVRYFSAADNEIVSLWMRPSMTAIPLALKDAEKELYYGMTLNLEAIIDE